MVSKPIEIYRRFCINHSGDRNHQWFVDCLDQLWDANPRLTDWLGFEQFCRDCLSSYHVTDAQKLNYIGEALGAFTGRGAVQVKH